MSAAASEREEWHQRKYRTIFIGSDPEFVTFKPCEDDKKMYCWIYFSPDSEGENFKWAFTKHQAKILYKLLGEAL